MNDAAAQIVAQEFLTGFFGVFDALMAKSFTFGVGTVEAVGAPKLREALEEYSVVWRARTKHHGSAVAVLMPLSDALRLATQIGSGHQPDASSLPEEVKDLLHEVADSALGGGTAHLMSSFAQGDEQLSESDVLELNHEGAQTLLDWLGGEATSAAFSYEASDIEGTAILVFSSSLEALVPAARLPQGSTPAAAETSLLSDSELHDILSGFNDAEDSASPAPATGRSAGMQQQESSARPAPPNLDMVLDIRLVATARLGRVEMPINEVLQLGPGSIVEVGHLVDEPVELLINDKLIARGDVVVVDEKFGLRITEIVSTKERIESLR
jgi:flagellar motor switch protein FliN/FliY